MKIFQPITVNLDSLLLDPNNPRLVRTPHEGTLVPDADIEKLQKQTLEHFDNNESSGYIDNRGLYESMRRLGYVGIDQLVVRSLKGSQNFVVVEGNRRVSTMKRLVQEFEEGIGGSLTSAIVSSFRQIRVMQLLTDNVPESEVRHRLSIILGLRHHGSLLEWEPLPKAHNIYIHYTNYKGINGQFRWEPERGREIASMLSIKYNDVRQSLRTYVTYLQLKKRTKIRSEYYSLIQAAVVNRKLNSYKYFDIDDSTFRLSPDSLEKMITICQFTNRHTLSPNQRIVPRPQVFPQLGLIVESANRAKQHSVRTLAAALLERVESGNVDEEQVLETSIEDAWIELRAFEEGLAWVQSLNELLNRQKKELPFHIYQGEGNDKMTKDILKKLVGRFRAILGLA